MTKRKSIWYLLITILLISLILPTQAVNAGGKGKGKDKDKDKEITEVTGSLTIHKYEREPGADITPRALETFGDGSAGQDVPDDAVLLEGVEFTVIQTHAYNEATGQWTEITDGSKFVVVTNDQGVAVLENLPLGRYTVEETDGPPHVNLSTEIYTIDIPMTNREGTEVNYDVHIYPKNEIIRGAVELGKVDGDTHEVLSQVTFELYNAADDSIVEVLGDRSFSTGEDGLIRINGLAYGDYYFKEVATQDGYLLGDQRLEFSITHSGMINEEGDRKGKVVEIEIQNYRSPDIEKEVDNSAVNRGETVTYSITTELPGDIHEYNSFVITDLLDSNLAYVADSWASTVEAFTFSTEGQLLTWTVTDFAALEGEDTVTITFDAVVSEDAEPNVVVNNKAHIEFENKHGSGGEKETEDVPVLPTAGSISIIKVDGDTEKKLAGATFELRDENGDTVATGTTDRNGGIVFTDIDYGSYEIVETKAPSGYSKLVKPVAVTINAEHTNETYTINNYKSGWELPTTGGMGTLPFTIVGLMIMGVALFTYFRRRKIDA